MSLDISQKKNMNATDYFLCSIKNTFDKEIPDDILKKAKSSLLDYIGVTLAGRTSLMDKIEGYLKTASPESGQINVVGLNMKTNLKDAVFLNGLNGHALDFDDGTNTGIIHLGSPIFSVLLPLAQKYNISSKKFLEAVVIGYEVSFTMAVSIQPKHKELGFHATGTCGILGVTIAAAYMLDFTEQELKNAFSIACISSTGMLKVLDDGSELKPYNVAKTALLGLISLQMARAGFIGHPDPLGGFRGFFKMMTGEEDIQLLPPLLKGTYAIEKTYTKPYAACRYCHPAIEAAINLKNKYNIKHEDVLSISVKTYYWAVNKHDHIEIPSSASAKMSIPYGVAVGLICGKAGIMEYDVKHVFDSRIEELTKKVKVMSDDELTEQFPDVTTAVVSVHTVSGNNYTEKINSPKGEPENPLSSKEFMDRFYELALYGGKSKEEANEIIKFVNNMDGSMERLFDFL